MLPTLSVKNLTKYYGQKRVVNDLSFSLYPGQIFGFVGPNGAGKSTTIKMITGLANISSGDVRIGGYSIDKSFAKAISNIGAVVEMPQLYGYLSGEKNLKLYASFYGKQAIKRIPQIVKLVGMENRIKEKVSTYSLGMKQRLGIAQALLGKPNLLILDEPTNGLDPNGIIDMRNFLKKIATEEGIAILVSSHILAEMELMCDTVGIMNMGRLESIKSIDSIKQKEMGPQTIKVTVSFPNYAGKLIMEKFNPEHISIEDKTLTVVIDPVRIPEISVLLVTNGVSIYSIHAIKKTLEDIFLETVQPKALPAPKKKN